MRKIFSLLIALCIAMTATATVSAGTMQMNDYCSTMKSTAASPDHDVGKVTVEKALERGTPCAEATPSTLELWVPNIGFGEATASKFAMEKTPFRPAPRAGPMMAVGT